MRPRGWKEGAAIIVFAYANAGDIVFAYANGGGIVFALPSNEAKGPRIRREWSVLERKEEYRSSQNKLGKRKREAKNNPGYIYKEKSGGFAFLY
jgi:hypothetical protein